MTIIWVTVLGSVLVLLLIFANFSSFCQVFAKQWYLYDTHEEASAALEAHHHAAEQQMRAEMPENKSEKSELNAAIDSANDSHDDSDDDPTADKSA